jgi:Mce-associated membrane protein
MSLLGNLDKTGTRTAMAVVTVLAVVCTAFALIAASLRASAVADGDQSIVDSQRTAQVCDAVSGAITDVFSYDYQNLKQTDDLAQKALTGKAMAQYRERFGKAAAQARADKVVLLTTVRSIGVTELRGNRATLLVFTDQQQLRAHDKRSSSGATLTVTAVRTGDHWMLTDIATS